MSKKTILLYILFWILRLGLPLLADRELTSTVLVVVDHYYYFFLRTPVYCFLNKSCFSYDSRWRWKI